MFSRAVTIKLKLLNGEVFQIPLIKFPPVLEWVQLESVKCTKWALSFMILVAFLCISLSTIQAFSTTVCSKIQFGRKIEIPDQRRYFALRGFHCVTNTPPLMRHGPLAEQNDYHDSHMFISDEVRLSVLVVAYRCTAVILTRII